MSRLAATQIPKPSDDAAFERACVILWQGLLKDPNVQRFGRSGQAQQGVDLLGLRDRDPSQLVGIQCKLKGDGKPLTEKELRAEFALALTFAPPLREYFVVTTAPDSAPLQVVANSLTLEQHALGRTIECHVWGWNTLEEKIADDAEARKAFDPSFTPFGEKLLAETTRAGAVMDRLVDHADAGFDSLEAGIGEILRRLPVAGSVKDESRSDGVEQVLDAQIDDLRAVLDGGDPTAAQAGLERLWGRVQEASGRIRFRVKANIGACRMALGDDAGAADLLVAAYALAPAEPKAVINKVLGLLLREAWEEARAVGQAALDGGNCDPFLACYVIQAARFDETVVEPLGLVPTSLHDAVVVRTAVVDFRRYRDDLGWRDAAKALAADHPDDFYARRLGAEAVLEAVINDAEFQRRRQLAPEMREPVRAAADTLADLWREARAGGLPLRPELAGLCANLVVGLHALDDQGAAVGAAREGMAAFPEEVELARYAAIVATDAGADDFVDELLPLLEQEPAGRLVAFRHYANRQDWPAVERLHAEALAAAPQEERAVIDVLGRVAVVHRAGGDRERALSALLDGVDEDPRAAVIVAGAATDLGFGDLADEAYDAARRLLTPDSHIARRLMVARLARRRGDWSAVADALDGWVDLGRDSEDLRVLALAYANETPARRRGVDFFNRLPGSIAGLPGYSQAAGLFHYNRGALGKAETALRRAVRGGSLLAVLALVETLRRRNRSAEIPALVAGLNPGEMEGDALDRMRFAQILAEFGDAEAAARLAYVVLQSAREEADVSMGYFGLFIEARTGVIPAVEVVGDDTWFAAESDDGSRAEFLIVADDPRPSEGRVTRDHPMVRAAYGLKLGETFVIDKGPAGPRTWTVSALKHKYLHAFHDITENFETRFPDAKGLWRFTAPEGDIQSTLDMIRRMGEADRERADLYLDKGLPLNMVGAVVTGSAVSFANYVRSLGETIRTTVGGTHELETAQATAHHRRSGDLVLDTYAAWTAATMGLLPLLSRMFARVLIAQSSIDELKTLRNRFDADGESMSVSWTDGQFYRQIVSAEEGQAQRAYFDGQLETIDRYCVAAPVAAPDTLTPIEELIVKTFGAHAMDPAYLAADSLLVSEDRHYRDAVRQMVGAESVWLQPILILALNQALLSFEDYARHLVQLAWRRHGHLSIDALVFFEAARADDSAGLDDLVQLCRFLGGPDADMQSHLSVAAALINRMWLTQELSTLKRMKATGIVLDALLKEPKHPWAGVIAILRLGLAPIAAAYVRAWVIGHFLPWAEVQAEEQGLRTIEGAGIRQTLRYGGRRSGRRSTRGG